jgi:pyridoxine 5-phosphate synthase
MNSRLNVNIDHVATVRQARRAPEPSVVAAAMACEQAGAHGITVHLRGDRRHIQDRDIAVLRDSVTTYLNVEIAATEEMVAIALALKPDCVTLVAENPGEITTEGGLDVRRQVGLLRDAVHRLRDGGITVSLFIDPDDAQVAASQEVGAQQIELCTAAYADATQGARAIHGETALHAGQELHRLRESANLAAQYGLYVAAGHGLTYRNVGALAGMGKIGEFNIGHNIIAHAIFVGLDQAVREMLDAIRRGSV